MAHGSFSATSASTAIVPADPYREYLLVQKLNATAVDLGVGIPAESGKGVHMVNPSDSVTMRGAAARMAIYGIGNGATGTWQDLDVVFSPAGPTP